MKSKVLKIALATAFLTGAAPAFANLIYKTGTQTTGTGLGAVSTVVTVQDNGQGNGPKQNGTESGCVTYVPGQPASTPAETCATETDLGVGMAPEGGDNTAGNAGNNTYFLNVLNTIAGLTSAGQLGFVVNINEQQDGVATLTKLYMSLYNTSSGDTHYYQYMGDPLDLADFGGTGQSGLNLFVLDNAQATDAAGFCPILSECVVGGGIEFAKGTTVGDAETVYVGAFKRTPGNPGGEIPEPGSLALLGVGAMAFGAMRRRLNAKK